ncbi:MAG TPA: hypothetical protein VLX92_00345 [Kofleriaceae bacterium]|nr:hypothetical protein [Kofleriaceae bacterium]
MIVRLAPLALVAIACNQDKIAVVNDQATADYNHAAVVGAIDKFVAAGRTPAAYGQLAQTVVALRPGMDEAVAQDTELKMIVLALDPVKSVSLKSLREQIDALALTVWPTLLSPPIEADALLQVRDPKAPELVPKPGEDADAYILRLCGGPLASECKRVVPEAQGQVVDALALRRATERARNAITECLPCTGDNADPRWQAAVTGWEELDRTANDSLAEVEQVADPDNWPISGNAADDDPQLPEAELSTRGDLLYGGHSYGPNQQRIDVLKDLRGDGDAIELHIHPGTTLAQVRGVLIDARKAGCKRVAVIAREPFYPWRRKAYWIADGYGMRANLRPTDSLQLLLHAIDEVAGPGTVARVD